MSNVDVLAFMLGVVLYLLVGTMVRVRATQRRLRNLGILVRAGEMRVDRLADLIGQLMEQGDVDDDAAPEHDPDPNHAGCRCASCVDRRVKELALWGERRGADGRREPTFRGQPLGYFPNYRSPYLPPPADPLDPYGPPYSPATLDGELDEGIDSILQVHDLELQDTDRGGRVEPLGGDDGQGARGGVGDAAGELELLAGALDGAEHGSSPSVGRHAGGAVGVVGASGVPAPGAGIPTVGDPADTMGSPSARGVSADGPVGEVLPPGVSPTAPTGANPTVRVVVSGTASEVAAVIASELLGLPDAYASAVRIHLRGTTVPCTDPACRRPHRLVGPS